MAATQTKIKSAQSKKELKRKLADKIETVLSELKNLLGEEEFQQRVKKAAKMLTRGLHNKNFAEADNLAKPVVNVDPKAKKIKGLKKAKGMIQELRADFWKNAIVLGANEEFNMSLEKAGRVADFLELGELMVDDALMRKESCGGHFRVESQTPEGEALRDDEHFAFVSAWQYKGDNQPEELHKEELVFENVHLTQRSYK